MSHVCLCRCEPARLVRDAWRDMRLMLGSQVGGHFRKSQKLFVPRIPLHSVNISECTGMRGIHTDTCLKIDICVWHSQHRGSIHSDRGAWTDARLRRVSKHAKTTKHCLHRCPQRRSQRRSQRCPHRCPQHCPQRCPQRCPHLAPQLAAARTAAHSAARDTARVTARSAARSAARLAARDAARSVTRAPPLT